MKPQAANNVKTTLMLDADRRKAESLEASDEEISAVIGQMAAAGKMDAKSTREGAAQERSYRVSDTADPSRQGCRFHRRECREVTPEPVRREAASDQARSEGCEEGAG